MATIAIVENSPFSAANFARLLERQRASHFTVRAWLGSPMPSDFDACILTGDIHNITDGLKDYHRRELELLSGLEDRKAYASCFSHQLVASARGGKVEHRGRRLLRWETISLRGSHPAFEGMGEFDAVCLNTDEVTVAPADAALLGSSESCANQVLAYGDNILTCQAHPELSVRREALLVHFSALALSLRDRSLLGECKASEPRPLPHESRFMAGVIRWLSS
jgi:GMP synthase-like glutamine amidotransferase